MYYCLCPLKSLWAWSCFRWLQHLCRSVHCRWITSDRCWYKCKQVSSIIWEKHCIFLWRQDLASNISFLDFPLIALMDGKDFCSFIVFYHPLCHMQVGDLQEENRASGAGWDWGDWRQAFWDKLFAETNLLWRHKSWSASTPLARGPSAECFIQEWPAEMCSMWQESDGTLPHTDMGLLENWAEAKITSALGLALPLTCFVSSGPQLAGSFPHLQKWAHHQGWPVPKPYAF